MAKFRSGKGNCDVHGEFDWSGYQLSSGEAVFGKWRDISSNFIECEKQRKVIILLSHAQYASKDMS